MTWTKLSDDFSDDCWGLSDAAYRLHSDGLIWSNRKLLDLHIPKTDLPRFAKNPSAITELIDGGWWIDNGNLFVIDHHGIYQRERSKVIAQQSANKANRAKRGLATSPSREIRVAFKDSNDSLNDSTNETVVQKGQAWNKAIPVENRETETEPQETVNQQTGEVTAAPPAGWEQVNGRTRRIKVSA